MTGKLAYKKVRDKYIEKEVSNPYNIDENMIFTCGAYYYSGRC